MKRYDAAVIGTWVALALTSAATLWLMLGPVYQGVSVTVTSGGGTGEPTRSTQTLIEANGLSVLPVVLAPVLLTALALFSALTINPRFVRRRVLLWVSAVLLLVFSIVGIASIGLFYLPAGAVLVASAIMGSRRVDAQA